MDSAAVPSPPHLYRQQQQNHMFHCVCVLDSHIAKLHIEWDDDTHQCILHIYTPPLGIQLSSIQMHNRSWIKQKHSGHTLRTQATAIITVVFTTVHTGVVNVGPPSDFPRGSPYSPLSLRCLFCYLYSGAVPGFYVKIQTCYQTESQSGATVQRKVSSFPTEMLIRSNELTE